MFNDKDGDFITTNSTNDIDFTQTETEQTAAFNTAYENSTEPVPVNKWALRDRLRSKVLWAAVVSELISIGFNVYQCIKYGFTPSLVEMIVMSILGILTIFGILNDPTNKEGF